MIMKNVGLRATQNKYFAKVHNTAPITRIEASFTLSKSQTCLIKRIELCYHELTQYTGSWVPYWTKFVYRLP